MTTVDVTRRLMVVDTDAGIDDACALLLALGRHRPAVDLLAVTTVRGNIGVDQVCRNVLRTLQVADRLDIPVYRGQDMTYIGENVADSAYYHGNDGLGDVPDTNCPDSSLVKHEHAALALTRLADQYPGQISLVCLAPLTNIAVAMKLDPDFGKKLRDCYIMGGNYSGKGNVTSSAEFNFFSDPEAADVVIRLLHCPITLVTWELCLDYKLSWEWLDRYTSVDTPRGRFVKAITASSVASYYSNRESTDEDRKRYITCDELAVAAAVDERISTRSIDVLCRGVDRTGRLTRGQLVLDWTPAARDNDSGGHHQRRSVKLVTDIDVELYERLLIDSVAIK